MNVCFSLRNILNDKLRTALKPYLNRPINEIRLRTGYPVSVVCGNATYKTSITAEPEDIQFVIEHAVQCSVYSHREQICSGFIDYNGLRIGLCGTGVFKDCGLHSLTDISSLNIRVPAELIGIFDLQTSHIIPPRNTLIISPPGCGKTTALRELVRIASENGFRVAVVDERNEIAAKNREHICFDLGANTDVMTNLPKTVAADMLLRSMNPEIIAVDELSGEKDIEKMRNAVLNGTVLFATCHGIGIVDAKKKGLDFFECYVVIRTRDGRRVYEFTESI